jgi:homoserine O-acetyltransferase
MADKIVATSGTAKAYGHGIMRLEGQIAAITADENFKGGDYVEEPKKGIQATGAVWAAWLYSPQWWRDELWRTNSKPGTTLDDVIHRMANGNNRGDANDMILQMRTWQKHDVGATPGFGGDVKKALGSIKVPVLYMPSMSDQYFPVGDARYEAQYMHTVTLLPIPTLWGHSAGRAIDPADGVFLNENIAKFLAGEPVAAEKVVPATN